MDGCLRAPRLTLFSHPHELVVVVPSVLLVVHAGLLVHHDAARCAGAARTVALVPGHHKHVEGLLQEGVLQEESCGVTVNFPAIRVA